MNTKIHPATGDRRPYALRLLFARFPVEEQETRLRDTLAASERGTLNLDHLILAEASGIPVGAGLVMLQADGIALVWPPVISCRAENEASVEDMLMQDICRRIDTAASRLGQCLLTPDDAVEATLLQRHGFEHAADMFFLARTLDPANDALGEVVSKEMTGLTVEPYTPQNSGLFAEVVEATYHGSLDCPYLTGFRTAADAIASHKLSGVFDPSLWRLYSIDAEVAGVALVNDHPDQNAAELVYLGVVPGHRGKRLGRRMLQRAINESVARGRAAMFLAVDCENRFANALYADFAFVELARRQVMLRRPATLARQ